AGDESLWKFLSQNERKASLPETEMEMTARILESMLNGEDDQWERMRWVYDEWKDKVMEQTGDTTNAKTPRGMLQRMLKRPFYVDPAMILVRFTYFKAHSILRPAVWSKTHQENHPTILSTLLRTFGLGLRFICSPAPVTTRDKSRKVVKVFRRWFGQMLAPADAREKSEDLAEVDLFVQDVEGHLRDDARNVGKTFNPAPDPNYDICSKEVLEEMERLWLEAMVKEEDGAFNVVKEGAHIAYVKYMQEVSALMERRVKRMGTYSEEQQLNLQARVYVQLHRWYQLRLPPMTRVGVEEAEYLLRTNKLGIEALMFTMDPMILHMVGGKDSVTDPVGVFSLSLCNRGMVNTVQKANLAITTGILRSIHSDIPLLHRAAFINIPPALSFFFSRSDRTTLKDRLTGAGWASFEADGTFVSTVLESKTQDVVKAEVEALRAFLLGVMSKTSASQKKTKGKGRGKGKGKEEFTPSGLDPQFSSDDVAAHPSVCLLVSSCSSFLMTKTTSNNKRDAEHLAPYVYFVYHAWKNVFLRFLAHDFCVRARNAVRDELSEVLTAFKFDMTVNLAKEGQAQVAALEMKRVYTFVDEHPLAAKTRKASCKPFADVEGKSGEVDDPADEAAAARAERLRPLLTESRQSFNTMLSKLRAVNGAVDIHAEKGRPFYSFVADPLEQLFRGVAIGLAFEDFLEHAGPDEVFVADEQGPYATVNIARTAPHPRFLWTRKTDDSAPPAVAPSNDMSAPAASPVPAPTPAPAPSAAAVAGPSKPTPPSPPAVTPNAQAGPSKPSAKATAARKKRASPSSSSGSSESESSTEEREEEAPAADRHESGNDSQESEEKGDSEDDEMKEDDVVGDDEADADADEDEDEEDPSSHSKSRRRRSKRLSRVKSSLPPSEEDEPPLPPSQPQHTPAPSQSRPLSPTQPVTEFPPTTKFRPRALPKLPKPSEPVVGAPSGSVSRRTTPLPSSLAVEPSATGPGAPEHSSDSDAPPKENMDVELLNPFGKAWSDLRINDARRSGESDPGNSGPELPVSTEPPTTSGIESEGGADVPATPKKSKDSRKRARATSSPSPPKPPAFPVGRGGSRNRTPSAQSRPVSRAPSLAPSVPQPSASRHSSRGPSVGPSSRAPSRPAQRMRLSPTLESAGEDAMQLSDDDDPSASKPDVAVVGDN
ncbi:hypothetical protein BXZ70DRAFT_1059660, partial [Cristinia sonorae]